MANRDPCNGSGSSGQCAFFPRGVWLPSPPPCNRCVCSTTSGRGRGVGGEGEVCFSEEDGNPAEPRSFPRGVIPKRRPLTPGPSPPARKLLQRRCGSRAGGEG